MYSPVGSGDLLVPDKQRKEQTESKPSMCSGLGSRIWAKLTKIDGEPNGKPSAPKWAALIAVVTLIVLTVAFLLTVHFYFKGFDNFQHWFNTKVIPFFNNTHISVGRALEYIALPIIGGTLLIAGLVVFGPGIKKSLTEKCRSNEESYENLIAAEPPAKKKGGCFNNPSRVEDLN